MTTDLPATMTVAGFETFGGPEHVRALTVATPAPGAGEVLVRSTATPVNPGDAWLLSGTLPFVDAGAPLPRWAGMELAGTVAALGEGVDALAVGDEVIGHVTFVPHGRGAHAAFVAVDARSVVAAPRGVDAVVASTIPMNGLTAAQCVDHLDGATVLVTGAGGAVGRLLVQLAAADGIAVTAIAGDADHDDLLRFGAVRTLGAFGDAGGGYDAVVDLAGIGPAATAAVRPGGRLLFVRDEGYDRSGPVEIVPISARRDLHATDRLADLAQRVERGELIPLGVETFAPASAGSAFAALSRRGRSGRRPTIVWTEGVPRPAVPR